MRILPKARCSEIITQESGAEILLYDLKTNQAIHLNETATFVRQNCDGRTTFESLTKLSGGKFNEDLILLTLGELQKHNLLH
jgi:hypothetical protein